MSTVQFQSEFSSSLFVAVFFIYLYIYPILLGVQKLNLVFYLRCICVLRCWFNLRVLVAPMKIRDAARSKTISHFNSNVVVILVFSLLLTRCTIVS